MTEAINLKNKSILCVITLGYLSNPQQEQHMTEAKNELFVDKIKKYQKL